MFQEQFNTEFCEEPMSQEEQILKQYTELKKLYFFKCKELNDIEVALKDYEQYFRSLVQNKSDDPENSEESKTQKTTKTAKQIKRKPRKSKN